MKGANLAMFWGLVVSLFFVLLATSDSYPVVWCAAAWVVWTVGFFRAIHDSITIS